MSGRLVAFAVLVWALALGFSLDAMPAMQEPAGPSASQPPEAASAPANTDCLMCHEDESAARADGSPVGVKPDVFAKSIHGSFSCVDCHTDLARTTDYPHPEKLAPADCSTCHTDTVEQHRAGVHAKGESGGATCAGCHGAHDILPSSDSASRTYQLNIAATCSRCHGDPALTARVGLEPAVATAFADSIHGRALSRAGLTVAPTCSDCHGAHDILRPEDPQSRVSIGNVPTTCGTCHEGITTKFNAGIHGAILATGHTGVPACQTCHTAHAIQRSESLSWQLSVIGQCGTCHADRLATFRDTFHGQVTNLGYRTVAGCADCHGAHEILPASDPRSPIAPANRVQTCGQCHENANENFVKYDPHADKHDRARNPVLYYSARMMELLLAGVFAFFGIHTTMWFSREVRVRRERRGAQVAGSSGGAHGRPRNQEETRGDQESEAPGRPDAD